MGVRAVRIRMVSAKREKFERIKDIKIELNMGEIREEGNDFLVAFDFRAVYEPEIGEIIVKGDVICEGDENTRKYWEENKKLPNKVMEEVLNTAMFNASVQATVVANSMRMAPPIVAPRIRLRAKGSGS